MKSKKQRGANYVARLVALAHQAYSFYGLTLCVYEDPSEPDAGRYLVVRANEDDTGHLFCGRPLNQRDVLFETDNVEDLQQWLNGVGTGRDIGTQNFFDKFFIKEVNNNRRGHVRFLFDKDRTIAGNFTFNIGDVDTHISFVKDISSHGVRFAIPKSDMFLHEIADEDNECRITYTEKQDGKEVRVSVDGSVAWFKINGARKNEYEVGMKFELHSVTSPVQRSCFLTILKKYVNPETEYER